MAWTMDGFFSVWPTAIVVNIIRYWFFYFNIRQESHNIETIVGEMIKYS